MDAVYIYDGDFEKGVLGESLIKTAAAMHMGELGRPFVPEEAVISREERGKPFFEDIPLEFSLTHSGNLWMCMFSDSPCGLDLQVMKECKWMDIAERFYLPREIEAVRTGGADMFFRIWVRKEAYCKMTGEGLFGSHMPCVLADEGEFGGLPFFLKEIEISDEMKCAVCTRRPADTELRILG